MMKVFRTPLWLGVIGATVLAIGSYGGGAVRYRGGVLDALGWSFLAFGHGAGMFNALFGVGIVLGVDHSAGFRGTDALTRRVLVPNAGRDATRRF